MNSQCIKVLLIEDNPGDTRLIKELFAECAPGSFELRCVALLSKGFAILESEEIDIILLDLSLPDSQGFETFIRVHDLTPEIPIIILTGFDDETLAIKAVKEGAQDYLAKGHVSRHLLARAAQYAIERKRTEEALRKVRDELELRVQERTAELSTEKERLAITLRSIGDGVISTDAHGRVTLVNKVAEELTGWSQNEALGQPVEKVFCITDQNNNVKRTNPILPIIQSVERDRFGGQVTLLSKNNGKRVVSASGAPIYDSKGAALGVILVFKDITEYLKIQEEMEKSHRLESVGILAGGIAHDFNNILMAILGNLSLAKLLVEKDNSLYKMLDGAEKASLRAKDLTKQLLTFSKGGAPIKEVVDLTHVIQETSSFALSGSNCRCEYHLTNDLWAVEADERQISQVIHNLVINASQAMPEGGKVLVSSENVLVTEKDPILTVPGANIKITIKDNGCGIEKNCLSKIFDPYYSTKVGGSGLGLASSYSIIKNHSGTIHVDSEPEKGSLFEIYLPATKQKAEVKKKQQESLKIGSGRVLVLDDEQAVRDVIGMMLASLEYDVDFANDGETAIKKYKHGIESGNRYDLVILDLTIPGGMGGEEVIHQLLEIDSEILAIVSSGYANNPILANYRDYGFSAVISKPFNLDQLSSTLADLHIH